MKKYLDSSLPARERAKDLLGRMSLDEKMGQITGFMPFPGEMEQLEKKHPHGVGAGSCLWMMGFECIEEAAGFQKKYPIFLLLYDIFIHITRWHRPFFRY